MDTSNIERLLETLIDEFRELKQVVKIATEVDLEFIRKDVKEITFAVQEIRDELDWSAEDKHPFAKQILDVIKNIERKLKD